jgi:hypothetical protein
VQLHIENPPQRFTSSGVRIDPERSDGLAPPKRVPRAKVSTAAKGSIPTTLGGKLPPISILSRRELACACCGNRWHPDMKGSLAAKQLPMVGSGRWWLR